MLGAVHMLGNAFQLFCSWISMCECKSRHHLIRHCNDDSSIPVGAAANGVTREPRIWHAHVTMPVLRWTARKHPMWAFYVQQIAM